MKNKLIFNGKEYELIETQFPKFLIYDERVWYGDIGIIDHQDPYRYLCHSLRIGDKFYALKIIE
jgi:hypothetical protein